MKFLLFTLLFTASLFSASVSQWSAPFLLTNSGGLTSIDGQFSGEKQPLDLTAFPNPFNPVVSLKVSGIASGQNISLQIFDLRGAMITDMSASLRVGANSVSWDAQALPSGLYLACLKVGSYTKNLRLALVK